MGAVFAAAGLVIVIVALLSLGTIQRIAKHAAIEAMTESKRDVDSNLTAALKAYDYLGGARQLASGSSPNMRQAERYLEQALAIRDDLPNAREAIASYLAEWAYRTFLVTHFNEPARAVLPPSAEDEYNANVYGAIRWFKEAIQKAKDDESGRASLRACLAQVYGLAGSVGEMFREIEAIKESQRGSLLGTPRPCLCLAGALGKAADYARARQLLPTVFPLESSRIAEEWNHLKKQSKTLGRHMERMGVWALRKSDLPDTGRLARNPGVVWLVPYGESQVVLQWKDDRQEVVRVPEPVSESPDLEGALYALGKYFAPLCIAKGDVLP